MGLYIELSQSKPGPCDAEGSRPVNSKSAYLSELRGQSAINIDVCPVQYVFSSDARSSICGHSSLGSAKRLQAGAVLEDKRTFSLEHAIRHLGCKDARSDNIDQHAKGRKLGCKLTRDLQDAALGSKTADLHGARFESTDRCGIHHAAIALLLEIGLDLSCHEESAREIGRDDLVPLFGRVVFKQREFADAGIVDEDIDTAEGICNFLHGSLDAVFGRHVADDRQALRAERAALLGYSLELLLAAGKDGYICTLLGQCLGICCAYARRQCNRLGEIAFDGLIQKRHLVCCELKRRSGAVLFRPRRR